MSAETPVQSVGAFTRLRLRFRDWRGTRPFWAGLFTLLGGVPIAYFPYATLQLGTMSIAMATTAGAGSLIIGVLLVTLGLTMWFQSDTRVFAGVAAIVLALVSLVVSNLGGFLIGFLFAMLGGALAVSWMPGKAEAVSAGSGDADEGPSDEGAVENGSASAVGEPGATSGTPDAARGGSVDRTPEGAWSDTPNGGYRVG